MGLTPAQRMRMSASKRKHGALLNHRFVNHAMREEEEMRLLVKQCSGMHEIEDLIEAHLANPHDSRLAWMMICGGPTEWLRQSMLQAGESSVVAGLFLTVLFPVFLNPPEFVHEAKAVEQHVFWAMMIVSTIVFMIVVLVATVVNTGFALSSGRDAEIVRGELTQLSADIWCNTVPLTMMIIGLATMTVAATMAITLTVGEESAYAVCAAMIVIVFLVLHKLYSAFWVWRRTFLYTGPYPVKPFTFVRKGLTNPGQVDFVGNTMGWTARKTTTGDTDLSHVPILGPGNAHFVDAWRRRIAIGRIIDDEAKRSLSKTSGKEISRTFDERVRERLRELLPDQYANSASLSHNRPSLSRDTDAEFAGFGFGEAPGGDGDVVVNHVLSSELEGLNDAAAAIQDNFPDIHQVLRSAGVDASAIPGYAAKITNAKLSVDTLVDLAYNLSALLSILEKVGVTVPGDQAKIAVRLKDISGVVDQR